MLLKALLHGLILCGLLHVINPQVQAPGFRLVLDAISAGAFTIVSASFAAGLHGLRALALAVLAIAIVASYPTTVRDLPRLTTPIAIGILLGRGCRLTLTDKPPTENNP